MKKYTASLLIHPEELDRVWIDRCVSLGIPTLALHPVGGIRAPRMMAAMLERLEQPEYRALIDEAIEKGLTVEYEMHAARYFLPGEMFETHPEWFRMNECGERTPDRNLCASNEEVMDYVAKRAAESAKRLYRSSHRYFFWLDDEHDAFCHCEKCSKYSSSDQQLMIMNRILAELKKDDPEATLAYLAYYGTLPPPERVKPAPGIFLEYAPIERDHHRALTDPTSEKNESQIRYLEPLLSFFGKEGAKVLDYWLDNSLFSNWTNPPRAFKPEAAVIASDFEYYSALGFSDLSTFACYLGQNYRERFGDPNIKPFADAYHRLNETKLQLRTEE